MAQPATQYYYDGLFDFALGMNSGINPLLLKRNQLANALDCTVRGTFVTHRPARRKVQLNYSGNIRASVEDGLWQGGCFYNSDTGQASLIGLISGRLFNFSITGTGVVVSDISISGDTDSPTATIGWLWQSENYVIVNDGQNLPIFYDGQTSRRSFGPAKLYGTINTNFSSPNVGDSVAVTLSSAYVGPYNVPVLVGDAIYQVVPAIPPDPNAQYQVTLVNGTGTPGVMYSANDQIISKNSIFYIAPADFTDGLIQPGSTVDFGSAGWVLPSGAGPGTQFSIANRAGGGDVIFTIQALGEFPTKFKATPNLTGSPFIVNKGDIAYKYPATAPDTTAATIKTGFTTPAVGASVVVNVTAPYTGTAGALVFLGSSSFYITAIAPAVPGTTVTLVNNTDTPNISPPGPATNRVAPLSITSIPELPVGRMGAYGMSRNWMSLIDGISFIAGDIVGGSSGTIPFDGRDAVLKISENEYLNGGGVFRVPGSVGDIRAMRFAATLDASLGQGPLQVYTPSTVFSCNTPVDRTTWQNLTNPILTESLIGNGAQGQNSTILANGDTFFRSIDGMRTLILARREFATWGNVPISREVQTVLNQDNKSLLQYGSAVQFDNRLLMTADPVQNSRGIFHDTSAVLNFDPISALNQKSNSVYDGFWTGLNVLQYITGLYQGVQRCFAFCLNTDLNKIELWEILSTDEATEDSDGRIIWQFETGSMFKDITGKGPFDLCQLTNGEVFVDNALGKVDFAVYYKPDEYADWTLWWSWSKTNTGTAPRTFPRMGLGEPSVNNCNPDTQLPLRNGYTFQLKFVITGHCRFLGGRFMASMAPNPQFAKPTCVEDAQ